MTRGPSIPTNGRRDPTSPSLSSVRARRKEHAMQISRPFFVVLTLVGGAVVASSTAAPQLFARAEPFVRADPASDQRSGQSNPDKSSATPEQVSDARRISKAFVSVAERLAPAVVRHTAREL